MDQSLFRLLIISLVVFGLTFIARKVRNKFAKPKYTSDNVQTPGKFETMILSILKIISFLSALFTIFGFLAGEMEMGLVFLGFTAIMAGSAWLVNREYNMTYQENETFFTLNAKGKEYKVTYDSIQDWVPGYNEILIYDQTQNTQRPIRVNVSIFQPVILLENIVQKTVNGHFKADLSQNPGDPTRKAELAYFLKDYGYDSLVEKYLV